VSVDSAGSPILRAIGSSCGSPADGVVARAEALFRRWRRDPDDLEVLRQLRDAIDDQLQDHRGG
jgi:hypothetical protein